jgi:hypothetical protein
MSDKRLVEQLHAIIAQAVEVMPKASASEVANWTITHHLTIVKEFYREWALEKLVSLSAAEMRRQRPMKRGRPNLRHREQSRLPGFEDVPYRLELDASVKGKHGRRIRLPNATLEDLKQRRALIRGQYSAEHRQLNKLIAIMEPYDRAQPGIRVAEALKLRAAGRRASSKLG